jgi:hypothetical protein
MATKTMGQLYLGHPEVIEAIRPGWPKLADSYTTRFERWRASVTKWFAGTYSPADESEWEGFDDDEA